MVVLQPTPFCNIDCRYCYLPDRSNRARMSSAVVRATFAALIDDGRLAETVEVLWHAGEPTALPISYYREAMAAIASLDAGATTLHHVFQTNATLLDDAWCDFIRDAGIGIGVSIDGPQPIHDAHRQQRNGGGTFEAVMRGIARLKARAIEFYCIAVVTDASADAPDALFDFFEALAPRHVCFVPEQIQGTNVTSSLDAADAKARFTRFLVRYLERIAATGSAQRIREIERMAGRIVKSAKGPVGSQLVEPFEIVTVDHQGRFSTFCPELATSRHPVHGDLALGNVLSGGMAQARNSAKLQALHAEIAAGVALCRDGCAYFDVCGGGAPSLKLAEHGRFDVAETQGCRLLYQAVADAVLQRLAGDVAAVSQITQ
ncbi:MAG: GRRM system radical SAM/SPASM domain protein [Proteobacteria bacterium]|nr:GRRM system radical SAM/SPASM domain protein [Pseudomonadota bacterium]